MVDSPKLIHPIKWCRIVKVILKKISHPSPNFSFPYILILVRKRSLILVHGKIHQGRPVDYSRTTKREECLQVPENNNIHSYAWFIIRFTHHVGERQLSSVFHDRYSFLGAYVILINKCHHNDSHYIGSLVHIVFELVNISYIFKITKMLVNVTQHWITPSIWLQTALGVIYRSTPDMVFAGCLHVAPPFVLPFGVAIL